MNKYYIVIEKQAPYVFKKYTIIVELEKLTEKASENIINKFECKNQLVENTALITFIQKLESED